VKVSSRIFPFLAVFALVALPRAASADGGINPGIHGLLQQGQDVVVELRLAKQGYGWDACWVEGVTCELVRRGPVGEVTVFDDLVLSPEEMEPSELACYGQPSPEACQLEPEQCQDCDGDSIKECYTWGGPCVAVYHHEVTDECVPPGPSEYVLVSAMDSYNDFTGESEQSIDVEDTGDSCLDCSGCSVGGKGVTGGECALALVMLFLGLASLRLAEKKRVKKTRPD
jgi:hypothetical protein